MQAGRMAALKVNTLFIMNIKHPKGLYLLFSVEMWERLSFYGMVSLLVLFMKNYFNWSTETAGSIYGWYIGLVFLTPVLGGYIADRFLGINKCIIIGSILIILGQFTLFTVPYTGSEGVFYLGLLLLIFGNGFFKSNISTMVGFLYEKDDKRKDSAFTIFYMGVNLGVALAPYICGTLGEKVAWQWGFFAAGVGMCIGLLIFIFGRKKYLPNLGVKPTGVKVKNIDGETLNTPLNREEKDRIYAILVMAFFVIFFWFAFKQNGASLTLFASESTNRVLPYFNWEVPASWFVSLNGIFILLFGPVLSMMWIKLAQKNKEPSTPAKFAWGLSLLSIGFFVMAVAAHFNSSGDKVSFLWLTVTYLFMTLGELCLSPVGLSLVTKLSPLKYASMLMGAWFIANFIANKLAGLFAGMYDKINHVNFFLFPAILALAASLILFMTRKHIKRLMHGVR